MFIIISELRIMYSHHNFVHIFYFIKNVYRIRTTACHFTLKMPSDLGATPLFNSVDTTGNLVNRETSKFTASIPTAVEFSDPLICTSNNVRQLN
jgi:hypothetical protein